MSEMVGPTDSPATRPDRPEKVPWRAVIVFVLVAFVLSWLIALPMWTRSGVTTTGLMMFAPLLATLVVVFIMRVPGQQRLRFLGMWPLRPAKRVVWSMVAAVFAPPVLVLVTVAVSAVFGWIQLDLAHFSGFAELNAAQLPEGTEPLDPGIVIALQIATVPIAAIIPNAILTFGEEIGWRGWLLTSLTPLGTWPALAVSGAVWGLWHMPVTLLGHNFGLTDWRGVVLMTIGCVAWGIILGWTRLRTASVWPAVIAHGALNAAGGAYMWFFAAGTEPLPALVNPMGVSGWIVIAVLVVVLVATGQFRQQPSLSLR